MRMYIRNDYQLQTIHYQLHFHVPLETKFVSADTSAVWT